MWSADGYLENLYEKAKGEHTHHYGENWREKLKNNLRKSLGFFGNDQVSLNPTTLQEEDMGSYVQLRIEISTLDRLKMPLYVLVPKNKNENDKLPAVIAVHGHGYGSKEGVGLNPDGSVRSDEGYHKNFAVQLVNRGTIVIAPELIGFGDRKLKADASKENSCYMMASQLLLHGKTLAGLRVQELIRVIDYACTLSDVDANRIGIMGISGGGLVTALTSILDERLKATVVSGYANTFKGSIMAMDHCLDNHIPGVLEYAELPELIGLIAPRSLFIEAGTEDPIFPIVHTSQAIEIISEIFKAFDATKSFDFHIFEGGHEINGEKSFDWLVKSIS